MPKLSRVISHLRPRRPGYERGALVNPRGWVRRNWIISPILALASAAGLLAWQPWQPAPPQPPAPLCGPGLTAIGSPQVCVGLDLDLTGFRDNDPLADLTRRIADQNSKITGDFATIVYLDNLTPDPKTDSDSPQNIRFRLEGAITAVWRANNEAIVGGLPKIKLLLASYGSNATSWQQAVEAIKLAKQDEHILATTGLGQSRVETRAAAAALSNANIATVGAITTADNMNEDLDGNHIENFVRVAPLNTDEARAAVPYAIREQYQKMLLVQDLNKKDSYAQTLASAFTAAYQERTGKPVEFTAPYRSPENQPSATNRQDLVTDQFAAMHSDICAIQPDLIYFAGRGVDLGSFLNAIAEGGSCSLGPLDVMTGDSASSLVGKPLPSGNTEVRVFYTGLAYSNQWENFPPESDNVKNHAGFVKAFTNQENRFPRDHLLNGNAMMGHDAVLAAAKAIRLNDNALADPDSVDDYFLRLRCSNSVPGASGTIVLNEKGNPINKAMPILRIQPDGNVTLEELAWPDGEPLSWKATC
jgi:ABC-type branched-subunit amino acid transport system substrate-binding protein